MITHVKFVTISTSNQDRALAFYTEKLGFKVVTDQPYDEKQRWIELRIANSDTCFVLFDMTGAGAMMKEGGLFNGALACDNIDKTYEELKAKGVEFIGPPTKQEWGSFAMFKDPDGNQFMLSTRR
jgi:catechol 2,3-dioxygenase-like lactoylglutathione lyase family enzyme